MAKLTDAEFMGVKGNILDVSSWLKIILGGFMVLIAFATSQNLVKKVSGVVPYMDGNIDPIIHRPTVVSQSNSKMYV